MQRYKQRANPRQIAGRDGVNRSSSATAEQGLEFGRFRLLLRRRELLADGDPVELGTRAFDLLLALLEADGLLVTKEELINRVWPGIVVSEENLKVQVAGLRKALGADRDLVHTEFGRGYRFTGLLRSSAVAGPYSCPARGKPRSDRSLFPQNRQQWPRCNFRHS
jgi:DNA-binding winged helix-turn-helix (wHTH) protein